MSRYRVTECQTERNSQLMLLAPSGPTCGCGTQEDQAALSLCAALNNTGLILSSWEGSLAGQKAFKLLVIQVGTDQRGSTC